MDGAPRGPARIGGHAGTLRFREPHTLATSTDDEFSYREGEDEHVENEPFIARVRLPNGAVQKIEVEADQVGNARAMLEAQYGKGNVIYVGR